MAFCRTNRYKLEVPYFVHDNINILFQYFRYNNNFGRFYSVDFHYQQWKFPLFSFNELCLVWNGHPHQVIIIIQFFGFFFQKNYGGHIFFIFFFFNSIKLFESIWYLYLFESMFGCQILCILPTTISRKVGFVGFVEFVVNYVFF